LLLAARSTIAGMDGLEEDISTTAALLAEDDGADVADVVHALVNVVMAVRRRARARRIAL